MIRSGLGTVQLGIPYGNRADAPLMPSSTAFNIISDALDAGIRFFDTAAAYGESEARLGDYGVQAKAPDAELSTKIPVAPDDVWMSPIGYRNFVMESLERSRSRLKVTRFGLLQFHQCTLRFLQCRHVGTLMQELLEKSACHNIGIAVYLPEQAQAALEISAVTALQIPVNLLDQRFLDSSLTLQYERRTVRLIARSILLQGVLVASAPLPKVAKIAELRKLRELLITGQKAAGGSLESLAFSYVFGNLAQRLSIALLGVDSVESLQKNLTLIDRALPLDKEQWEAFADSRKFAEAEGLLNPSSWQEK